MQQRREIIPVIQHQSLTIHQKIEYYCTKYNLWSQTDQRTLLFLHAQLNQLNINN